ncbi:hypothetical protein LCGC14_0895850, partial [marine sediment metagenome]
MTSHASETEAERDRLRDISTDLLEALEGLVEAAQAALDLADDNLRLHFYDRLPDAQASYDALSAAVKIANAALARANEESTL